MNYYIEQIEEDIKKCKNIYEGNYGNIGKEELQYIYYANEISEMCREMIGYYGEDVEFPSFVYQNFDQESLYMIMRLLDKHRRYILDRNYEENYKKEIDKYKDQLSVYEDKIKLYRDRIEGLEKQVMLLKENINAIIYSKQAINIFTTQTQEVATTVDLDMQIENRFENARSQIDKDNEIEDKQEILDKINELELIYIGNDQSKAKMDKAKNILSWLGNKSYKAMQLLMPLIQTIIETNASK